MKVEPHISFGLVLPTSLPHQSPHSLPNSIPKKIKINKISFFFFAYNFQSLSHFSLLSSQSVYTVRISKALKIWTIIISSPYPPLHSSSLYRQLSSNTSLSNPISLSLSPTLQWRSLLSPRSALSRSDLTLSPARRRFYSLPRRRARSSRAGPTRA